MCPQYLRNQKGCYLAFFFYIKDVDITTYNSVLVWHGVFVPVFYQHRNTGGGEGWVGWGGGGGGGWAGDRKLLTCSLYLKAATEG